MSKNMNLKAYSFSTYIILMYSIEFIEISKINDKNVVVTIDQNRCYAYTTILFSYLPSTIIVIITPRLLLLKKKHTHTHVHTYS